MLLKGKLPCLHMANQLSEQNLYSSICHPVKLMVWLFDHFPWYLRKAKQEPWLRDKADGIINT